MQSFKAFWPLLVPLFILLSDAKNFGLRQTAPLPSLAITSKGVEARMVVPEDHVFYTNYAKEVIVGSVEEKLAAFGLRPPHTDEPKPNKRRNLWAAPVKKKGDRTVSLSPTRVRGRTIPIGIPTKVAEVTVGPDDCLECAGLGSNNPAQIGTFTTTYFIDNMLKSQAELFDTCIFYTAVFFPEDYVTWNTNLPSDFFDPTYKEALSHWATEYACNSGLFSIWMLWPGKAPGGENPGGTTDLTKGNFWEIFVPGSWLYPIQESGDTATYFQTMSTSMAMQCGGVIHVMSIAPKDMTKYKGTIWIDQELETLKLRIRTDSSRYKPTYLVAIDAVDLSQYLVDWDTLTVQENVKRGHELWLDPDEIRGLQRRADCEANIAYEDATRSFTQGDWFG